MIWINDTKPICATIGGHTTTGKTILCLHQPRNESGAHIYLGRTMGCHSENRLTGGAVAGWNPLDVLDNEHAEHQRLCDNLEAVADSLPDEIDPELCAATARALRFDLPIHYRDEEDGLFPLLAARARPEDHITDVLDQLRLEHANDESFAADLIEQLENMTQGRRPGNPDMLGYMLRGFFEGYRRHINWEQSVIMPLARTRLTVDDLNELSKVMGRHRVGINMSAEKKSCNGDCGACTPDITDIPEE